MVKLGQMVLEGVNWVHNHKIRSKNLVYINIQFLTNQQFLPKSAVLPK